MPRCAMHCGNMCGKWPSRGGTECPAPPTTRRIEWMTPPPLMPFRISSLPHASNGAAWKPRGGSGTVSEYARRALLLKRHSG